MAGSKVNVQITTQAVKGINKVMVGNCATVMTANTTGITPVSRTTHKNNFSFKVMLVNNIDANTATGRAIKINIKDTNNPVNAVSASILSETNGPTIMKMTGLAKLSICVSV